MASGKDFWTLPISEMYWQYVYPNYMKLFSILKKEIYDDLGYYERVGYTLFITFTVIIFLFTIPIYIGNKRIERQEEYVFDLMTSISPDLI